MSDIRISLYGLVEIFNLSYLDTLHKLFVTDAKPICVTAF